MKKTSERKRYADARRRRNADVSLMTLCVMQLALFAFRVFLGTTSFAGILSVPVQIGLSMLAWPLIYPAAWAVRKAGA